MATNAGSMARIPATTDVHGEKSTDKAEESAGETLINCPELLEGVLLLLDMGSLLRAQQVSRRFKATIAGSVNLQRALWFVADPNITATRLDSVGNPLIMLKAPELGIEGWMDGDIEDWMNGDIEGFPEAGDVSSFAVVGGVPIVPESDRTEMCVHWTTPASPARPGSWRRMLLTQPSGSATVYRLFAPYVDPDVRPREHAERVFSIEQRYARPPTVGELVADVEEWREFVLGELDEGREYSDDEWEGLGPARGA
ncbi:hypothetical protein LTR08_009219 [Meristemomyces frigidus]|nr:hypothetical protein LTR08_009219 [Meristemomyces frigidus]